jgi:hypothetical protein
MPGSTGTPASTDSKTPTTAQWRQLQELASRFEEAWREAAPAASLDLGRYLPPPGDPLRPAALHQLIKSDLEIRWRRGQGVDLNFYLAQFPELGPAQALPAPLIYEEYRIRRLYGDKEPLSAYQARFPDQFGELLRLIQEHPSFRSHSEPTLDMAPPPAPPPPAPPPPAPAAAPGDSQRLQVVGDYHLIQSIGKGSFAEVWRAEGPGGTEVAVKIISHSLSQEEAQREKEALEHVKRLRHPYLVQTQAYYAVNGRLYVVMDLADCTLNDRVKECREQGLPGLPLDELLRYMREAAEGLDYLHSVGVHHRDVKPANLLLLKGHVKVADFGLAKPLLTQASIIDATLAGTAPYMAPEVWQSKVSKHSDQWSLAVTYAELRLQRRLFKGSNPYSLGCEICRGLPDLSSLPAAEQQVLHKALAMNPSQRYKTCAQLAEALEEAHRPKPPPGPPPRPAWRRRLEYATFTLAALVLAGLFVACIKVFLLKPRLEVVEIGADASAPLFRLRGQPASVSLRIRRHDFSGPVKVSGTVTVKAGPRAGPGTPVPPDQITIEEAEVAEGDDEVTVDVKVGPRADPGTYDLKLRAEGPRGAAAEAVVRLGVICLPDGCAKASDEIVPDDFQGVPYYKEITRALEGTAGDVRVKFVLVPEEAAEECWEGKRDKVGTFYMMQDKVSLGLFRAFAARHPQLIPPGKWDNPKRGPRHPALDVTFEGAQRFAERGLKGKLPSRLQWDKAAGRYKRTRGTALYPEGPYRGTWDPKKGRKPNVAVLLDDGPRDVGRSTDDKSPFECQDMAGNGTEWTGDETGRDAYYRGREWGGERPFRYSDMEEKNSKGWPRDEPLPDGGFRVVIEP